MSPTTTDWHILLKLGAAYRVNLVYETSIMILIIEKWELLIKNKLLIKIGYLFDAEGDGNAFYMLVALLSPSQLLEVSTCIRITQFSSSIVMRLTILFSYDWVDELWCALLNLGWLCACIEDRICSEFWEIINFQRFSLSLIVWILIKVDISRLGDMAVSYVPACRSAQKPWLYFSTLLPTHFMFDDKVSFSSICRLLFIS